MSSNNIEIKKAAEAMRRARFAVALTGAGISVPSGIPDFRSPGSGLWEKVDPFEAATIDAFERAPEKFFAFLGPLSDLIRNARPNAAHEALARMEAAGRLKGVITQNIDNLHQAAGLKRVAELHGNGAFSTCRRCGAQRPSEALDSMMRDGVPRCDCGGVMKPDVILFGESLPMRALLDAEAMTRSCDLMLVVGSSLTVMPAASLPHAAHANGADVVVVNKQETYADAFALAVIREGAETALPAIFEEMST